MHSGLLIVIRRFLVYAKPWQQVLACTALVAVGIALIAVGIHVGVVMAVIGILFGWQIIKAHRSNRTSGAEREAELSGNA